MSKKTKIVLNLSVIAIVLASVAQVYTNHRIDQSLQQFPYYFSDKFTIHVTQQDKNFFTRDLVFSISSNDDEQKDQKTDIISTHLTALPFAITAESTLPQPLIRKLNEKLNITIDSNLINSRFSVVGDYLQSTIYTKFRDVTNTAQSLETDLNYMAKNNFIELETNLSGLNYETVKLNKITGKYSFRPLSNNYYDINQVDMKLGDINIVDGENNQYKLEKVNYQFGKTINMGNHDIESKLDAGLFSLINSNKNVEINNLAINSKNINIPNNVSFYEKFRKINKKEGNVVQQSVNALIDYLLEHQQFQLAFSFSDLKNTQADLGINLNNAAINLNLDKSSKVLDISGKITTAIFSEAEKENFVLKNIEYTNKSTEFELIDYAGFLQKYFPSFLEETNDKNQDDFLKDLQQLAIDDQTKNQVNFNVAEIKLGDVTLTGKNIQYSYTDEPINQENLNLSIKLSADELESKKNNVKVTNINLNLPVELSPLKSVYSSYFCMQYYLICQDNLSADKYQSLLNDGIMKSEIIINNGNIQADVTSLSLADKSGNIKADFSMKFKPVAEKTAGSEMERFTQGDFDITLDIAQNLLINDEADKDTNNFWYWLKNNVEESGLFIQNGDNYNLKFIQQDGSILLNGKDPNEPEEYSPDENIDLE